VNKPSKAVKKTAEVPSPAVGKRKRQSKADREFEELVESLRNRQPWKPEPWTRDYEGEARRGANIARTRERSNEAADLIDVVAGYAMDAEGAETYAAERLALLAEEALDKLAAIAKEWRPTPAAEYAGERRADIARRLAAEVGREIKRRQRGSRKSDAISFSDWATATIEQVARQQKRGFKQIDGIKLPIFPFGIRGVTEVHGQDVKICWRNCLLSIIAKVYADERMGPPGKRSPWRNRQRQVKQIIDRAWREAGDKASAAHRRWVARGQTGDY